jgi:nitric oxide reductase NorD protein
VKESVPSGERIAEPAAPNGTANLERLEMLGSALAGLPVSLEHAGNGEPAWTDGRTIYIDADTTARERLSALAVQSSLIAAGSLTPELASRLIRRPNIARRYLAIEGARALQANSTLLPSAVSSLLEFDHGSRVTSSDDSLELALSREPIPEPPAQFGVIHPRKLLAKQREAQKVTEANEHIPRKAQSKPLEELDEDAGESADFDDPFSSPVGGSGPLGKLFAKLMSSVRKLGGSGPPGSDSPTHRTRVAVRGANSVSSRAKSGNLEEEPGQAFGYSYPEWDIYRRQYRWDWCTVREPHPQIKHGIAPAPSDPSLRRPLARLGLGLQHCHRQAQGDDIDIDAAVEARVAALAGSSPDEAVYVDTLRRRRDLGVLVLLDVSGSTAEPGAVGHTVHEQQRATAAALTDALHQLGDRVALYAFASQGRSAVNVMPIKQFHDHLDSSVMQRLYGLVPGAYSRLGAAIRHGATVLEEKAGTPRRLLVVISDGLAYDLGYERDYGAADARRALAEARQRGTGCLCLTVGAGTDVAELRRVFGSAAHATIPRTENLAEIIGAMFRSALSSAEARRRQRQRKARAQKPATGDLGLRGTFTTSRVDRKTSSPTHASSQPGHIRDYERALHQ